jgi:photosystem II stability/assembly factor-like uncharacterized protein
MVSTPEPWCIWGVDQNTAFVGDGGAGGGAGGNAKVWKTTNGGVNWNVILTTGGTAGFINSIVFSRTVPNAGYIQSDPPTGAGGTYWLQRTTDGGNTWTLLNPPGVTGQASSQNGLVVIDDQFLAFGTGSIAPARILWSSNGGTTWNLASTSVITGGFVSGLAIRSDKQVWICGTDASLPNIARSTTGGATWSAVNTGSGSGYCTMKWVYTTNYCYLSLGSTGTNLVKESTDGGVTWSSMTNPSIPGITYMDLVYTDGQITAYAISGVGNVIKLQKFPNEVIHNPNAITAFKLGQNYPNPFNPRTVINYSIPKQSFVTLKIYDVLGKEIKTIVNEIKSPGNYNAELDAAELGSGVYYYTINAGFYTETKKMVLIK